MARRTEDIDLWVGSRIGELRREKGLSQSALASALGLSFQQIQKYEAGLNRVSAARLYQLAQLLDCTVAAFFPLQGASVSPASGAMNLTAEQKALLHAFPRIDSAGLRRSVLEVVEALALR